MTCPKFLDLLQKENIIITIEYHYDKQNDMTKGEFLSDMEVRRLSCIWYGAKMWSALSRQLGASTDQTLTSGQGKTSLFPVLFFYQDPLIIKLPLLMNTSLRARRKAIRRLCVGKSVKVCVYQTMLGTACDRLCPAHQGKTSYRCLVAYNRAEVGWGEVVCQCHTFKASKHWNNFYEFACMGEFNCAFCPTCDLAISQSDIFHPGHQLPLTLKTLLYCCSWTKQKNCQRRF